MAHSLGLRLRALAALFVFTASLGMPLLSFGHYTLDDDRACGSVQLTTGHPGVQLEAPRPVLPQDHCALCHWLRAVGGSRTTSITTIHVWLEPSPASPSSTPESRPAPPLANLSSRAPPSTIA